MRRLILLLTLIPSFLFGQDLSNSVGVVTISEGYDNTNHIIEFLNDDGSTWQTLNLYNGWNNPEFHIIAFKPDYFLFKIRCNEQTANGYKVVVNEQTGLTKLIPKSDKVKLVTWEQYMLDVFSIDFDPTQLPIYDGINGSKITELPTQYNILVPTEIKGDWMRIIWSDTDEYPTNTSKDRTGWIRWKTNNKINVKVYHLC